MPNKNYLSGRRFEYECMENWRERGYETIRAAGSHGVYDIVAFRHDRKPEFIQCKVVQTETMAKRLIKKYTTNVYPSSTYHQTLMVKVKRGETLSRTI